MEIGIAIKKSLFEKLNRDGRFLNFFKENVAEQFEDAGEKGVLLMFYGLSLDDLLFLGEIKNEMLDTPDDFLMFQVEDDQSQASGEWKDNPFCLEVIKRIDHIYYREY